MYMYATQHSSWRHGSAAYDIHTRPRNTYSHTRYEHQTFYYNYTRSISETKEVSIELSSLRRSVCPSFTGRIDNIGIPWNTTRQHKHATIIRMPMLCTFFPVCFNFSTSYSYYFYLVDFITSWSGHLKRAVSYEWCRMVGRSCSLVYG